MKQIKAKTFRASVVFGLYYGYSNEVISTEIFKKHLNEVQHKIKDTLGICLSLKLMPCQIFFLGQDEPSMEVSCIQYPKFLYPEEALKKAFLQLATQMMHLLHQNRTCVIFNQETILLEVTPNLDSIIKL